MHQPLNATMIIMQIVPRLIDKFIPENYKLSLKINQKERTFSGLVTIIGSVLPNTLTIDLHSKDLSIISINFDGKEADFSASDDILSIAHEDLNAGKHIVDLVFEGKINDSMHGMYPCLYEQGGLKKELIATQFESHHAREVFPCIDEPEAKATFDLTLTTDQNQTVLGNMPIKFQRTEDNKLVTTFETSPVMSSYLLAWVIGDLQKKSGKTRGGVEVNIWSTPAQPLDSLDFALDIAIRSIEFYNQYFGIDYPLKKSDHVALPDFSSGAMENWGLITYREIALLADPKNTSISGKQYIATVVAHELSHQWFGNLVTMKWWNELWLNESFASLMEYVAVDALQPNWNIWLDFASFDAVIALKRDSLDGVQPVKTSVNHPDEIATLFDGAIVYAKGARLLHMLKKYIGEDAFRSGLTQYFRANAYKNTIDTDLWKALGEASQKDIKNFMETWILQPGYPVLHVSKNSKTITLVQERLRSKSAKPSESIWPIPLNSNCPDAPEIMTTKSISFNTDMNELVRFNVGNFGHYIVNYDAESMKQIVESIRNGSFLTIDRVQLLNEQTILANMGITSYANLIPLIQAFENETEDSAWDMVSLAISELKKFVIDDESAEKKLKSLVMQLTAKQFDRLGWDKKPNEPESDTKLRSLILGLMVYAENPAVMSEAMRLFQDNSVSGLDPELRGLIIVAVIMQTNDEDVINWLIDIYKTSNSSDLKQDLNIGLTATRNPETIKRLLNLIKDSSIIRSQDVARWVAYLIRNKYGRDLTWQWIMDNWNWLETTFKGDMSYDDYPRYAANALINQNQLNQYVAFFSPLKTDPALTRVIEIGINEITDRVELIKRDGQAVRDKLLSL
jgi:aminopeptidase N